MYGKQTYARVYQLIISNKDLQQKDKCRKNNTRKREKRGQKQTIQRVDKSENR